MAKCKHKWEWIGETSQSTNEWCPKCGAWKRTDSETGETTINVPRNSNGN